MREFCNKLNFSVSNNLHRIITVEDMSAAVACQKYKSACLNGIYMESFMFFW